MKRPAKKRKKALSRSVEARAAMRAAARARCADPAARAALIARLQVAACDAAVKARAAKNLRRAMSKPAMRARLSERAKALWQDPAYAEKVRAARAQRRLKCDFVAVPQWVPAVLAPVYRRIAHAQGEAAAARFVRALKRAVRDAAQPVMEAAP